MSREHSSVERAWIQTIRYATGLPITSLCKRLQITKQALFNLERREVAGTISIAKLREVADALNCDVIYGFIPREPFVESATRLQQQQDRARRAKRKIPAPD